MGNETGTHIVMIYCCSFNRIGIIDWGDQKADPTATITKDSSTGIYTIGYTHRYISAGTYSPIITITADGRVTVINTEADITGLSGTGYSVPAVVGTLFSGQIATFTDTAPNAPTQAFPTTIVWGDGHTQSVTPVSEGGGNYAIFGTNTYSAPGIYDVAITVNTTDGHSNAFSAQADVTTVTAQGQAIANPQQQGQSFTGPVASFSDTHTGLPASDYNAFIDWGDGNESDGIVSSDGSGGFVVTGSNIWASSGSLNVTVIIADSLGAEVTATTSATVDGLSATGGSLSCSAGNSFYGKVATVSDSISANHTFVIDWGDGITEVGTLGLGDFYYGHSYTSAGSYSPTITIIAYDGQTYRTATCNADVQISGMTGSGEATAIPQSPFSGQIATFFDSNPGANQYTSQNYHATTDFGGGNTCTGVIASVGTSQEYTVSVPSGAGITFSHAGVVRPVITINCDRNNLVLVFDAQVNVTTITNANALPIPSARQGQTFDGTVATFIDSTGQPASEYSASIDWGDGKTSDGLVTQVGGTYYVSGVNTFGAAGTLNLVVTITDPSGAQVQATETVSPVGKVIHPAPLQPTWGQSLNGTVVATFTDNSPNAGNDTAYIDYGDGNWVLGTFAPVTGSPNTYSVTGNGTLPQGPTAQITVYIYNPDGTTTTTTTTYNDDMLQPPTSPSYSLSPDGTSVTLTWTDTAHDDRTGFQIEEENVTAGSNYVLIAPVGTDDDSSHAGYATLGANIFTATITRLSSSPSVSTQYNFRVMAIAPGESAPSGSTMVLAQPAANTLSTPQVTAGFWFQFDDEQEQAYAHLTWSGGDGADHFDVQYQEQAGTLGITGAWVEAGTTTENELWTAEPLANLGQTFNFRVIAVAPDGSVSNPGMKSGSPGGSPGGAPTFNAAYDPAIQGLAVWGAMPAAGETLAGGDRILIVQNGIVNDVTNASWHWQYSPLAGQYCSVLWYQHGTFDVELNLFYYHSDDTHQWVVMSQPGKVSGITAPPPDPGILYGPSNLSLAESSDGEFNLTWNDMSTNEAGFQILESINGGDFTQIDEVGGDQNSAIEPMPGGNLHSVAFMVEAVAVNGAKSPRSNTATVNDGLQTKFAVLTGHTFWSWIQGHGECGEWGNPPAPYSQGSYGNDNVGAWSTVTIVSTSKPGGACNTIIQGTDDNGHAHNSDSGIIKMYLKANLPGNYKVAMGFSVSMTSIGPDKDIGASFNLTYGNDKRSAQKPNYSETEILTFDAQVSKGWAVVARYDPYIGLFNIKPDKAVTETISGSIVFVQADKI